MKEDQSEAPCQGAPINCQEFLSLVDAIMDGEATQEEKDKFKSHSSKCHPCAEKYKLDNSFFETVRKKICREEVPAGLASQILSFVKEKQ